MIKCVNCGFIQDNDNKFCGQCGAKFQRIILNDEPLKKEETIYDKIITI